MTGETWLLLETSGRGGQVGLVHRGIIAPASLDPARRHNRDLARVVRDLLQQAGLAPRHLAGVMVSIGPGSFTGLRVGVMSAKMLAYALGCSLIAVPTFHTLAEATPPPCQRTVILSDGLQGLVYAQPFQRNASGWQATDELRIVAARELAPQLAPDVWLGGPGVDLLTPWLASDHPRVPIELRQPRLENIWQVGQRLTPLTLDDVMRLEPLYLRPSSAEEQANRREAQAILSNRQTS